MPMNGTSSIFGRQTPRGGNPDRAGLAPAVIKIHTLLDGARTLGDVAQQSGLDLTEVVAIVRGLELAGLVERRAPVRRTPSSSWKTTRRPSA